MQSCLKICGLCGKCVEGAGLLAAWHDEVACAFRRGGDQQRRFDLGEALVFHGAAHGALHDRAVAQVALHPFAAHVEVAVLEAQRLVDVLAAVQHEGRRLGLVQDLDGAVLHVDRAGGQERVLHALGSRYDRAGDAHDVFTPQVVLFVNDALDDAGVIAQVDEGQLLAVLSAIVDPTAQGDLAVDVVSVSAHRSSRCACRGRLPCQHRRRRSRRLRTRTRRLRLRSLRLVLGSLRRSCQPLLEFFYQCGASDRGLLTLLPLQGANLCGAGSEFVVADHNGH